MITYKIFPEQNLLVVITHSRKTADPAYTTRIRKAIRQDPRYSPNLCVLSDSRKLGDDQYVYDEIYYIATMQDVANPKIASVVSTPVSFGVSRTWEALSENDQTQMGVFYDLKEALVWLGQPPEMVDKIEEMAKATPPDR